VRGKPLDTNYSYDRSRVIELTQLICRDLESKPVEVDRNRIYNCIRSCYTDYERGYSDNPEHYATDLRMLLQVCSASNWFSPKQFGNIRQWCYELGW
jgi:hypothetical protein